MAAEDPIGKLPHLTEEELAAIPEQPDAEYFADQTMRERIRFELSLDDMTDEQRAAYEKHVSSRVRPINVEWLGGAFKDSKIAGRLGVIAAAAGRAQAGDAYKGLLTKIGEQQEAAELLAKPRDFPAMRWSDNVNDEMLAAAEAKIREKAQRQARQDEHDEQMRVLAARTSESTAELARLFINQERQLSAQRLLTFVLAVAVVYDVVSNSVIALVGAEEGLPWWALLGSFVGSAVLVWVLGRVGRRIAGR